MRCTWVGAGMRPGAAPARSQKGGRGALAEPRAGGGLGSACGLTVACSGGEKREGRRGLGSNPDWLFFGLQSCSGALRVLPDAARSPCGPGCRRGVHRRAWGLMGVQTPLGRPVHVMCATAGVQQGGVHGQGTCVNRGMCARTGYMCEQGDVCTDRAHL